MSRPVILDPEARAEFDNSYDWYEQQQVGLGEQFADQVQLVFDRIGANPRMHAIVLGSVRKAVVRRFPFCVYYREESACVRVIAVFHTSRDPDEWQRRA
jgi:plasmid stabilization system protein ParE